MRELLERWSSLEPERCGLREGGGDTFPDNGFPKVYWLERRAPRSTGHVRFHGDGRMQIGGDEELFFAVLDAIEARGWDYRLVGNMLRTGMTHAVVWPEPLPMGTTLSRKAYGAESQTAAAALLGAYLTALEAEGEQ